MFIGCCLASNFYLFLKSGLTVQRVKEKWNAVTAAIPQTKLIRTVSILCCASLSLLDDYGLFVFFFLVAFLFTVAAARSNPLTDRPTDRPTGWLANTRHATTNKNSDKSVSGLRSIAIFVQRFRNSVSVAAKEPTAATPKPFS